LEEKARRDTPRLIVTVLERKSQSKEKTLDQWVANCRPPEGGRYELSEPSTPPGIGV
jgi:hypothetical protein